MEAGLRGVLGIGLAALVACGGRPTFVYELGFEDTGPRRPITPEPTTGGGTVNQTQWGGVFEAVWTEGSGVCDDSVALWAPGYSQEHPTWTFGLLRVEAGYTAEDCVSPGSLCHEMGLHARLFQPQGCGEAVAGYSTLFGYDDRNELTWFFGHHEVCYTWGADPAYYTSLGCTEL